MAIKSPDIKTTKPVIPIIYCFTTPEIARHNGWSKIGYSEQDADTRIGQETVTVDVQYKLEWKKNAVFEGTGKTFSDHDFHAYLTHNGIERMRPQPGHKKAPEWFHIMPVPAKHMLEDFRENQGAVQAETAVIPYVLRKEQQDAVDKAKDYFLTHEKGEFLFNCKPRFGKTLTVYDLCKAMKLKKVLIVTNRPAIANSWRSDYCSFLGRESGYLFVSEVSGVAGKPGVLSRSQYANEIMKNPNMKLIEFVSLQDMKGSLYFGGQFNKLEEVKNTDWDILVIDEAHEGVDTLKTDIAFDQIKRKYTLHLSGTPFKALANDKFEDKAIFNWTYTDEQKAKRDWDDSTGDSNPYQNLPRLNMYTYQMSEIVKDQLKHGIEINGETEEYAFDLNEFFATNDRGFFIHDEAVDKFLDALTTQSKYPFSTPELRDELKHTFWLLNRVDSAKALAKKLKKHPVFKEYYIVLAAGDGKLDDTDAAQKSFDAVKDAISKYDKTITLSVGQLTTGITIPEWSAVLMLSSLKSPSLYMQAAFRAQNPCLFKDETTFRRKQNAYLFDFDPARTLIIYDEFANDLNGDTAGGKGDSDQHKQNVRELLNFFPVIGEDENGEMIELDAEKVLSIPRKIKSREVVRRGFMSDFLFQNISHLFNAPQAAIDLVKSFEPIKAPKNNTEIDLTPDTGKELNMNPDGDVEIPREKIIGTAENLFGDKIYDQANDSMNQILDKVESSKEPDEEDSHLDALKHAFHESVSAPILQTAAEKYGNDLTSASQKKLEKKLNAVADNELDRTFGSYKIQKKSLEAEHQAKIDEAANEAELNEINKAFEQKQKELTESFKKQMNSVITDMVNKAGETVVETVETDKKEKKKQTITDQIRDHLRGFARTIPSFLMAYGTDSTTLQNFDQIVPDEVFIDVTSITLDQFRFLRDGGDVQNKETGEMEHFDGNLFEPVVFNDSVKEFMSLRQKLANYFDATNKEDIFDYIPPQKTNQIFTPRKVVIEMVDDLEEENPGCFDDSDKTFADLYMKSGMYITEIVKRLYNSDRMKQLFPDNTERLNHIFAKQVYGLAPTEIIYQICLHYILGFSDEIHITKHNIRKCDAMEYIDKGTFEMKLKELFPELGGKS